MSTPTIIITGKVMKSKGDHDTIHYGQGQKSSWARFRVFASNGKREDGSYGDSYGVNISCFGALADHVAQSLHENDTVIVVGRIRATRYKDGNGNDQYGTEVTANEIGLSLRWDAAMRVDAQNHQQYQPPAQPSYQAQSQPAYQQPMPPASDPWGGGAGEPEF